METFKIEEDIPVICVKATSFPEGIMDAFNKLHQIIQPSGGILQGRVVYGLSRMENGTIQYWAGATELHEGEAKELNCEKIIIKKGNYISKILNDYMSDLPQIGNVFQKMISRPDIDPEGYCVEWYFNKKDVRCMVRLRD